MESFNVQFSSGDVGGWLGHWDSSATFYSAVGPVQGADIRSFFDHQIQRYDRPHLEIIHKYAGPWTDGVLAEGVLTGACRGTEHHFKMPILLFMKLKDHRIASVFEAFRSIDDGCGPFWRP
jgi:hypothetical protein